MDPASVKEEQPASPKRCSNLCGFFANANCGDMCSKCSREVQSSQEQAVKAIAATAPPPPPQALAQQQLQQEQQRQQQQQDAAALASGTQPAITPQPISTDQLAQLPSSASPVSAPTAISLSVPAVGATSSSPTAQLSAPEVSAAAAGLPVPGVSSAAAPADDDGDAEPPRRIQKHTNRCFSCSKKVGLTGFKCRCGYIFCGPHRLAEAHSCDYDYKASGREHLAKANPLVQADRVQRF